MFDWEEMSLFGSMIKLRWLRDNILPLLEQPTEEQLHAHVRAYLLGLIGGVLMLDKTGNKVHLMYLSLLTNLRRTRKYSWGSACLAMLYREMCRATKVGSKTIGGCASLLMS
uniref:Serine/threonine protein phosphatase 7 long form isogeny n=1 Tax=Cajanus cajan TaxID=3821 RepID=A0A151T8T4_CAJCA|nr:Serine/threonine protein phosphatase 7 long form isogeny [Cajanus cajan]